LARPLDRKLDYAIGRAVQQGYEEVWGINRLEEVVIDGAAAQRSRRQQHFFCLWSTDWGQERGPCSKIEVYPMVVVGRDNFRIEARYVKPRDYPGHRLHGKEQRPSTTDEVGYRDQRFSPSTLIQDARVAAIDDV
jgi:hypothetical protein